MTPHDAALSYLAAGFSVIPIRTDGSKAPTVAWDEFKTRLATPQELLAWFGNTSHGLAILGGAVSGGLAVFDFEFPDFFQQFSELVEIEAPGLIEQLPQIITPGKTAAQGRHLYLRVAKEVRSQKLARLTEEEAEKRTGDKKKATAIEIKGEGGYCLAPGCPPDCHETKRTYQLIGGPAIEETPTITLEEFDILLSCARALDQVPIAQARAERVAGMTPDSENDSRPGTIFNRRASWEEILVPHGWVKVRSKGTACYWRRPGKTKGISATTGFCSNANSGDLLCVFSSNASPLEIGEGDHKCFNKFGAFAYLECGGDFKKAALVLAERGYLEDLNLDLASAEACFIAAKIEKLRDSTKHLEEIMEKLSAVNISKGWNLTPSELERKAAEGLEWRISQDPDKFGESVQNAILETRRSAEPPKPEPPSANNGPPSSANPGTTVPLWHLIIVESEPKEYWLRSPRWSKSPLVAANGGYIRLSLKELGHWPNIYWPALEQTEIPIPKKMKGWEHNLEMLMATAARRQRPDEDRRSYVIIEFIWDILKSARDAEKKDDGTLNIGTGHPKRLPDGRTVVKFNFLMAKAADNPDLPKRKELLDALLAAKMVKIKLGNSRWWAIDPTALSTMRNIVVGIGPDALDTSRNGEVNSPGSTDSSQDSPHANSVQPDHSVN